MLLEDVVRRDAPATLAVLRRAGRHRQGDLRRQPVTVGAVARRAGLAGWDRNSTPSTLPGDDDLDALADALEREHGVRPGHAAPEAGDGAGRCRHRGHTVAMTGDGVNDVLALKDADCGVAMASGSEATRGVAQLVLLDSNFSALPQSSPRAAG